MTTITTTPARSTNAPSTGRPLLTAITGVAVGVAIGWFAASAVDDDPAAAVAAATVAEVVPSPLVMSPDAMTRWAETGAIDVVAPSALVMSPDAMTRWAAADATHQQLLDRAACERLSQGLAGC